LLPPPLLRFPGALRNAPGILASAERGTVFLDEIGQLTPDLQGKLLRVLQEKEIRPAGATHRIPLHERILAASSVDPAAAVTKGTFRKDLYCRLNVVTLRIPPLRFPDVFWLTIKRGFADSSEVTNVLRSEFSPNYANSFTFLPTRRLEASD
jgi:transcriptional regulator with GAF, ATPase, and Fis domain